MKLQGQELEVAELRLESLSTWGHKLDSQDSYTDWMRSLPKPSAP